MIYVLAKKLKNGGVQIFQPPNEPMKPATHWLFIDKNSSQKPDYRHKRITLNCYTYPIFWIKEVQA